ncbi:MAG: hypothetical protein WDO12_02425 [Pseudomonadota bacterium]
MRTSRKLSQYIVAKLRESLLVVDEDDRIRLLNEPAAGILGTGTAWPGALLGECSRRGCSFYCPGGASMVARRKAATSPRPMAAD